MHRVFECSNEKPISRRYALLWNEINVADERVGKMELFTAAIGFWTLLYLSVEILNFINKIQCRNFVMNQTSENCPQRCTCDTDLKMVNCTNANFTFVPSNIAPDTRSLIMDGNMLTNLGSDSFRKLRTLSNLSLRNCQIKQMHRKAFSSLSESLRML